MEEQAQDNGSTDGPYILRELIRDIPLEQGVHITCVDTWNGNLYIGTSAGEILHYVSIPPDPADESGQPSYIFATKLEPPFTTEQEGADQGVKQILLLPAASKACILCNGTLSFYTLPELSPAFGGKVQQNNCLWVGGLDAEEQNHGAYATYGTVIVICLKNKFRLVRVGEDDKNPRRVRDIELGGVCAVQRSKDVACVADGQAYSLLDVVNQRKNELFPISSLSVPEEPPQPPEQERPAAKTREQSRSFSSRSPIRLGGHERNISLGGAPTGSARLRPDSSSPWPARSTSRQERTESPAQGSPAQPASREGSPTKAGSADMSARTSTEAARESEVAVAPVRPLLPNVAAPTPNEFLLTTGTKLSEPGVGMFVNHDGDVVRGTLEFSTYPQSLVLDGGAQTGADESTATESEGYVLAVVQHKLGDGQIKIAVEVQRWDAEPGDATNEKQWLVLSSTDALGDLEAPTNGVGLRLAASTVELSNNEISQSLRLRRAQLGPEPAKANEAELKRNQEEDTFASRFAQVSARVLLHHNNQLSWIVRTALITRLETQLDTTVQQSANDEVTIDVSVAQRVFNSIRGQDATNELDFLTLTYIRQKASLLLFGNLLLQTVKGTLAYEHDKRRAEEALVAGEIDPRVVLGLVPPLTDEVDEGEQRIWISQGLRDTISTLRRAGGYEPENLVQDPKGAYGDNLLQLIKRYLFTWRKKKGMASVADELHVFKTVDAALLHVLLMLGANSPRGPATAGTVRAELNDVVDKGLECFDRAKELFEQHNRLYMLSRLYQSRKNTAQVLATWRRIIEGGNDAGGELMEGEYDVRKYLTKLRDPGLMQEYGSWLANRNPKLGVQVFADDTARVKFQPQEAVAILKEKAPGAVKDYLEHLVFGKNHVQYVNDLIAFYLDTVLAELERSNDAKQTLLQSYETYRALRPPKPTYRQFITDNAVDAEWWHNRLRLLQLIGGSHGAASKYNIHTLGERLAPYSDELVPEMIILNGREGKHEEALRLLTHGLGDYDTAIRYCLLGGSSIFHPGGLEAASEQGMPTKEQQSKLFNTLLHEFLRLSDLSERLERTSELLERFGGWFDIAEVLALIPESWSVELLSGFLVHGMRRLVREKNETVVVKALRSAQNLRRAVDWIEKTEAGAPVIVRTEESVEGG